MHAGPRARAWTRHHSSRAFIIRPRGAGNPPKNEDSVLRKPVGDDGRCFAALAAQWTSCRTFLPRAEVGGPGGRRPAAAAAAGGSPWTRTGAAGQPALHLLCLCGHTSPAQVAKAGIGGAGPPHGPPADLQPPPPHRRPWWGSGCGCLTLTV